MNQLFNNVYQGKRVLLTGHTGFKGSWLYLWLLKLGATVQGYAMAPDTEPAHIKLLGLYNENSIGNIAHPQAIKEVFQTFQPDIVFHLAAQPLVRYSYQNPVETFQVNVLGTANVLEAARLTPSVKAIVNITSDKVYENFEWERAYKETDKLGGHDPYSTSKACAEMVHESYTKSFFKKAGILSATARAGNVIGGGDWAADRLIPDIVRASINNSVIEIRNPDSVRPWQHVLDPLSGYLQLGMQLLQANTEMEGSWNFGPALKDCISVREVLNEMSNIWGDFQWKDISLGEKVHEANMLRLDCTKAHENLMWQPIWNLQQALTATANWYKAYYNYKELITTQQLDQFIKDAQEKKAKWATIS